MTLVMPRPAELEHFAHLIAQLTVAAARTDDPELLDRIAAELEEAHLDLWSLLLSDLEHDARCGMVR